MRTQHCSPLYPLPQRRTLHSKASLFLKGRSRVAHLFGGRLPAVSAAPSRTPKASPSLPASSPLTPGRQPCRHTSLHPTLCGIWRLEPLPSSLTWHGHMASPSTSSEKQKPLLAFPQPLGTRAAPVRGIACAGLPGTFRFSPASPVS